MNFNKLKAETAAWVEEGIISAAQATKILARYDGEVPAYKKMSFWLQAVAATLAGLALFLIISANWQHLHWAVQSIVAALPLVGSHAWALYHEKRDKPLAAELGWFLASIALGANIMLQAQIFHISSYYPNGILFWVIGMLPVLWFRTSTVSYLLAVVLFSVYLILQAGYAQFSPVSILPLLVLAWFAWVKQHLYTILPLLWILYLFLFTILEKWNIHARGLIWEFALVLFSLALIQQFQRLKADWLRRMTMLFFILTAFFNILLTFKIFARNAEIHRASTAAFIIMGISVVALFFNRNALRERHLTLLTAANILLTIFSLWLQRFSGYGEVEERYFVIRIAANVIYLGSVVALMFRAIALREKFLFMGSIFAFLLWALIRYFDLFANYLITALIFGLSAGALIVANKLWEKKYEN